MARNSSGSSTDSITIPDHADFRFNTDVCILAILRPTQLNSPTVDHIVMYGASGARGYGLTIGASASTLNFVKVGIADVTGTATTALTTNVWYAVMAKGTTGGDVLFKRYDYRDRSLATETVTNSSALNAPQAGDSGRIFNVFTPTTTGNFGGDIGRLVILQGTPTDAEFTHWARYGRFPSTVAARLLDSRMIGRSPELDFSGNGHNGTVTGTSVVAREPVQLSRMFVPGIFGRVHGVLGADVGGGQFIPVGQATETDTAQAVAVNPIRRLIGQAVETDTSQAVDVEPLRRLVNVAAETDTAQVVAVNPIRRLINQVVETDTAQAVDVEPLRRLVSAPEETDTAQTVAVNPIHRLINQAVETDEAQAVDVEPLRRLVGQAVETDEAQAITSAGAIIVGQTAETDTAQTVTWAPKIRIIGQAVETDTAQTIDVEPLRRLISQAVETDTAQTVTASQSKVVAVNQATETDAAQAITWAPKIRLVGQTQETDEAQSLGVPNIVLLGQAAETSAAQSLVVLKVKALGLSVETDTALVIDIEPLRRLVGQATETDASQVVTTIIAGRAKIILLEDVVLNHGAMESVAANLADLQDVTLDI